MLFLVGVILAAVFMVSEWAEISERASWFVPENERTPARWFQFVNLISHAIIAVTGITLLMVRPVHALDLLDWVIVLMFAWSALSLLWATNRWLTVRWLGCWLAMSCFVFGVGLTCSLDECLQVVASGYGLFLVVGLLHEIFTGRFKLEANYRFWGCVGPNRQAAQGWLMFLIVLYAYQTGFLNVGTALLIGSLSLAVLILGRSRTVMVSAVIAMPVWIWLNLPTGRVATIGFVAGLIGLCLIAAIPASRKKAFWLLLLGRDKKDVRGFNGRTIIWTFIWPYASQHPILGNGFRSVWTDDFYSNLCKLHDFGTRPAHAHNDYLDSLVNGGVIALLLFVLTLVMGSYAAFHLPSPASSLLLTLIIYAAISALGEGTLVLPQYRTFAFFALLISMQS